MMKFKALLVSFFTLLMGLAFSAFLLVTCPSWPTADSGFSLPTIELGTPDVSFVAGTFPADTEELTLVVERGEISRLDGFTHLRYADLSGSLCYDEIAAWAQAHPEVEVRYTVTFPNGATLKEDAESLDLSGLDSIQIAASLDLLQYLPKLKSIDLGSTAAGSSLKLTDFAAVQEACPQAQVLYQIQIAGQSLGLDAKSLDLSHITHNEVAESIQFLPLLGQLETIDLGSSSEERGLTWEDVGLVQNAAPQATVSYSFSLYGKSLNTKDESLDFNHITMEDRGAAVRAILPYMKNCTYLDMDFCNVSNEDMAVIRDENPNMKVVWRIWFGESYSVRTDVIKILASKPSKGGVLHNDDLQVLKYCTDLKYLDLGHNEAISDISFVNYMPNLEVLIIAMNPLVDISPLANCPHMEYIELNSTSIADLSPLSGLTELRHLNIGNCPNVTDLSPLYSLTELERLWIGCITPIPADQVAAFQELDPDCTVNTTAYDPTSGNWREIGIAPGGWDHFRDYGSFLFLYDPRYDLLSEQFGYRLPNEGGYSFYWNDPLYGPHD